MSIGFNFGLLTHLYVAPFLVCSNRWSCGKPKGLDLLLHSVFVYHLEWTHCVRVNVYPRLFPIRSSANSSMQMHKNPCVCWCHTCFMRRPLTFDCSSRTQTCWAPSALTSCHWPTTTSWTTMSRGYVTLCRQAVALWWCLVRLLCQLYRMYTVYTYKCMVLANPTYMSEDST